MTPHVRRAGGGALRPGFTLVEIVVVLAILGVLAGVVAVAARPAAAAAPASAWRAAVATARARALATGRPVHIYVALPDAPDTRGGSNAVSTSAPTRGGDVLALPDGRVLTDVVDPRYAVDALTGAPQVGR